MEMKQKVSLIPTIKEVERFANFLNEKFDLNLPMDKIVFSVMDIDNRTLGYFQPSKHFEGFKFREKEIHHITLNTKHLRIRDKGLSPYETIAHELAHFINNENKVVDCSSNQYHNKHFKKVAEQLLLDVERTNRGYSRTTESDEFILMLEKYKPNYKVFEDITQKKGNRTKQTTRNYLYVCEGCGLKIRCGIKGLTTLKHESCEEMPYFKMKE